ncbi:MAG: hypothetical protein V3R29_04265 [Candidatus Acidoferrales bacterium]
MSYTIAIVTLLALLVLAAGLGAIVLAFSKLSEGLFLLLKEIYAEPEESERVSRA